MYKKGQKLTLKIEGRFGKTWNEEVTVVAVSDLHVMFTNGMMLPHLAVKNNLA